MVYRCLLKGVIRREDDENGDGDEGMPPRGRNRGHNWTASGINTRAIFLFAAVMDVYVYKYQRSY